MIPIETLVAWGATYRKVAAEETIFREGEDPHFYYQLVSGAIRWVNITDAGREFIQSFVEPGESFGEFALFDDLPYAASAIATSDSVVLRLQKHSFLQQLRQQPDLFFAFSKLMATRMRFKFLLLKELSCKEPEEIITALFAYFKKEGKNICQRCNRVMLTRQQLADMTGFRVETVIRTVKALEQKGAVVIDRGKIFC